LMASSFSFICFRTFDDNRWKENMYFQLFSGRKVATWI
jgi:hypothetical protein